MPAYIGRGSILTRRPSYDPLLVWHEHVPPAADVEYRDGVLVLDERAIVDMTVSKHHPGAIVSGLTACGRQWSWAVQVDNHPVHDRAASQCGPEYALHTQPAYAKPDGTGVRFVLCASRAAALKWIEETNFVAEICALSEKMERDSWKDDSNESCVVRQEPATHATRRTVEDERHARKLGGLGFDAALVGDQKSVVQRLTPAEVKQLNKMPDCIVRSVEDRMFKSEWLERAVEAGRDSALRVVNEFGETLKAHRERCEGRPQQRLNDPHVQRMEAHLAWLARELRIRQPDVERLLDYTGEPGYLRCTVYAPGARGAHKGMLEVAFSIGATDMRAFPESGPVRSMVVVDPTMAPGTAELRDPTSGKTLTRFVDAERIDQADAVRTAPSKPFFGIQALSAEMAAGQWTLPESKPFTRDDLNAALEYLRAQLLAQCERTFTNVFRFVAQAAALQLEFNTMAAEFPYSTRADWRARRELDIGDAIIRSIAERVSRKDWP